MGIINNFRMAKADILLIRCILSNNNPTLTETNNSSLNNITLINNSLLTDNNIITKEISEKIISYLNNSFKRI